MDKCWWIFFLLYIYWLPDRRTAQLRISPMFSKKSQSRESIFVPSKNFDNRLFEWICASKRYSSRIVFFSLAQRKSSLGIENSLGIWMERIFFKTRKGIIWNKKPASAYLFASISREKMAEVNSNYSYTSVMTALGLLWFLKSCRSLASSTVGGRLCTTMRSLETNMLRLRSIWDFHCSSCSRLAMSEAETSWAAGEPAITTAGQGVLHTLFELFSRDLWDEWFFSPWGAIAGGVRMNLASLSKMTANTLAKDFLLLHLIRTM